MKRSLFRLVSLLLVGGVMLTGCAGGATSSGTASSAASGTASGTTSSAVSGTASGTASDVTSEPGGTTVDPNADPIAAYRYTPETISYDPSSRDFRNPAENYEKIQFPEYDVNDPPRLVEYTDDEKREQRVRGVQMKQKVLQATISKAETLTIEPGVYRFAANDVPFNLAGAQNLTIIGEGVELILEGFQQAFKLSECKNVTFVGFTVDRDPYRHTQFIVQAFNKSTLELTVQVMEGYEPENAPAQGDIQFFDDDGTWRPHVFTHYTQFRWIDEANRIGVYSGVDPVEEGVQEWLIGTIGATILAGGYHIIKTDDCTDMNFVDIVNYGGSMMGSGSRNNGTFRYLRNKDMPRPGTNSLIAGGFGLVEWESGGPIVEDSVYCHTNDDVMDVVSWNCLMYKQESANTLLIGSMRSCPINVGDTLIVYDRLNFNKKAEAKVVSLELYKNKADIDAAVQLAKDNYWIGMSNHDHLIRVVLDQDVEVTPGDTVENYTSYRPDFTILRGCLFYDVFTRLLIQGVKSAEVDGCVFLRTGMAALSFNNDQGAWAEGKTSENVRITNNVFQDTPWSQYATYGAGQYSGSINIGLSQSMLGDTSAYRCTEQSFSNFLIEGNRIINPMFAGIVVRNTANVTIRNNTIENPVTRANLTTRNNKNPGQNYYGAPQDAAIFLYACSGITLENNVVKDMGTYCKMEVRQVFCEE